VENLLNQTMRTTQEHFDSFMSTLNSYNDVVNANRVELNPPEPDSYIDDTSEEEDTSSDDLNLDML
jgi:hypothetical protein